MRRVTLSIVIVCFLIPAIIIFYKLRIAGLSFFPVPVSDLWSVHMILTPEKDLKNFTTNIPIPKENSVIRTKNIRIDAQDLTYSVKRSSKGNVLNVSGNLPKHSRIRYEVFVQLGPKSQPELKEDLTNRYRPEMADFLNTDFLSESDSKLAKDLAFSISGPNPNKTEVARNLYYYVHEEILSGPADTMGKALLTKQANPYTRALLYVALARLHNIPSRIVAGVNLNDENHSYTETRYPLVYWNEVFLNAQWIPVCLECDTFASEPDTYLTLYRDLESLPSLRENEDFEISVYAEKVRSLDPAKFKVTGSQSPDFFSDMSLYNLPLPLQNVFRALLLVPMGAVLLSVARNLIGLKTFGIFTPILLTLFFRESSLLFGLAFFFVIITFGFFERFLLDKLYLLAVPRLSIVLTGVVGFLLLFSLVNNYYNFMPQVTLTFFPIVIATVLIERFSIMLIEEGIGNTMYSLTGTLAVSIACFYLFQISILQIILFTHPELLLIFISILLLIGEYKGYRLTEFFRFRDLVRRMDE